MLLLFTRIPPRALGARQLRVPVHYSAAEMETTEVPAERRPLEGTVFAAGSTVF